MSTLAVPMPPVRAAWKRRLIDSALARIVIFFVLAMLVGTATTIVFRLAGWIGLPKADPLRITAEVLVRVVPMTAAYLVIVHFIERRRADELALRKALPGLAAGLAGGALLIATVMLALWLAGAYAVTGMNSEVAWARPVLVFGFATAVAEEIIFRGVLFRVVDETWGLAAALAVSALFFGGVHILNQNANLWTSFAIAVEAGVLLGVVYHVTRSLWTCIGLHTAWNVLSGSVFGSPVSGIATESSWLAPRFAGPDWLTGGAFGIEGSVLTVLLSVLFSAALLAASRRRAAHNGADAPKAA